jgi:hypothetical protein
LQTRSARKFSDGRPRVSFPVNDLFNLIDLQVVIEVELNARVILEHLEANRILAADELLFRIDANVQIDKKADRCSRDSAVFAAEDVGVRWCFECRLRKWSVVTMATVDDNGKE